MKTLAAFALGIAATVAAIYLPPAVEAQNSCSVSTFQGAYVFTTNGAAYYQPFGSIGRIVTNGNGTFTGRQTASYGGYIDQGRQVSGTYTINPDCTGIVTFTQPEQAHLHIAASSNGGAFTYIQIDPGTVVVGSAFRQ